MKTINNTNSDQYGFTVKKLNSLAEIAKDKTAHYVYNEHNIPVHFLYMPAKKSKGLVVTFHGARGLNRETGVMTPLPIFRGFNYPETIKNISFLCICDPLFYIYSEDKLRLSWYLDTVKHKTSEPIKRVIESIHNLEENKNLLFMGTSGGGFPAIKFAGIFQQKALLSNSQLMVDKYEYFDELSEILSKNDDKLLESTNICAHLKKYGYPEKITLYINKDDKKHLKYHAAPFYHDLEECGNLNILDYHAFNGAEPGPGQTPHHIQWPCDYESLIIAALDSM